MSVPSYDWIRERRTPTTGELGGFYVAPLPWTSPRGEIYAFGSTLLIHPLDLAGIEAVMVVRQRMWRVLHWLREAGVEP